MANVAAIRNVVGRQAFRIVFQPIVDLDSVVPVGFEALTRFDDDVRPDHLFARARRAGVDIELEAATLAMAVRSAETLPGGAFLSLNVSPRLILEDRLLAGLLQHRTRGVVLEITEHEAIEDYAALRAAIAALGSDGRVAVDDAGAGEANLRHLVELRPDLTKMDMSLVRGIDTDLTRRALAAGLQEFARATGTAVVAEGIETEAERRALLTLGMRLGQGFLLGRPAAAEAWTAPCAPQRRRHPARTRPLPVTS